ncbi:dihydrofolate reductase family protein [Nocardia caishijiensis]|uniref:Dihydrofolate reductase n=1 Tax=Nocardia caishijiensis TaxID=184756 RepID=A0ABQ6YSA4_9NOCA|nr:dihydrofolate reductase family protein [Nocardia caishijiensis]KAF0848435.1 dihydrofolate reductase [Nocardia caishijiensis]
MRKITAGLFMSLDGVVADPQDWHFPYFDDAMGAAVDAQLGSADTLLLGRVTYDGFADAWPGREADGGPDAGFAKKLGDARKLVVTHQNPDFPWRNSERLDGELTAAAAELRKGTGGDIAISGSVSVVRQLLAAGLLDELHLLVHPIAVGKGDRLFEDGTTIPLRLLSSETFETGVLHLVYTKDDTAPSGSYEDAKAHLPEGR